MNPTISNFIISVAGAIIVLLLGAVVYFLKKWIESTDSLTRSVNDLKTAVALLQTNQNNSSQTCVTAHSIIDKRLNAHSERLNEHAEAITELKAARNPKRGSRNMLPILILSLFLFSAAFPEAQAQTITYLKVADKPEYAKYLEYCNTPVPRTFFMNGAVTILKTNNYYVQPNGDWMAKVPLTIKWYPIGTKSMTFEPYQKEITAKVEIMVPMRYPTSIDDFYKNWKTGNIQEGLVDSKTCGLWPALK